MKTVFLVLKVLMKALLLISLVLYVANWQFVSIQEGLMAPEETRMDTLYLKKLLLGKIDHSSDSNFVRVSPTFTNRNTYLETNTYSAFVKMHRAAKADGIDLQIVSGARSFDYQKMIWERKWAQYGKEYSDSQRAEDILRYSAMPGTSRHHWGTDIDINNLNNSYFEQGRGHREYTWLKENALRFGFCQVYTSKEETNRKGYEMERWHWSYLPVSIMNTRYYARLIGYTDLVDFNGSSVARELLVVDNYALGVWECNEVSLFK